MREQTPRNLPWLEQLAVHIPGYGGYLERGNRRAADRALRDAIARRLAEARNRIDEAIRACLQREQFGPIASAEEFDLQGILPSGKDHDEERLRRPLLSEVNALERVRSHLDRIASRLQSAGSGTDSFYTARNLDPAKADGLHAFDMALFRRADSLLQMFETPTSHDFLAGVESELNEFKRQLDERTNLLLGIK